MTEFTDKCKYISSTVGILAFVFVIVIVTSIDRVQFNEFAFSRAWGQAIDRTKVFKQGVHMQGFWKSFVVFPADIVELDLQDLEIFSSTSGADGGTSLEIDVSIQYRLDPDTLSQLFDIGGLNGYESQIRAESIQIIKNVAIEFNADEYLTRRTDIEARMQEELELEISRNFANTQIVNVQMLRVPFPNAFYERKLLVALQELDNEVQNFTRLSTQVREQTEGLVLIIENEANRIVEVANAEASLTVAKAENDFTRRVGQAADQGMRLLADSLNITEQADFLSLNYLIQLLVNKGSQQKFVNFNSLPDARSLV